ncbi:hypothetical protein S40285_04877 [Stachybotrys chlorohalonatus IBT 40285]|uniref:Uncharacterized protein n=1 Tax=Stachybotrys chlorohalonatus (strain IBT 40285) TaxID=1283841 RepID=A0A084QP63_STAC4|nr:hypothetical protein S40285_04877 [Stachybotrys chlorohalonata IBT 40285]
MAPVRRYLRISKYSVLECRIYLDNPNLAQSWLLNPRNPILPQVIESIRPLVLPKLREERERSRKKSAKKKSIKDVIVKDDFEVSMFLTETNTRHSLLTKQKHFREKLPAKMQSNSSKLMGETVAAPIDVDVNVNVPIRLEEDDVDDGRALADIPFAPLDRQSKRSRMSSDEDPEMSDGNDEGVPILLESEDDQPPHKRRRQPKQTPHDQQDRDADEDDDEGDDKKKLAMDVSYEGFSIYGRVLCLVIKRRETKAQQNRGGARLAEAGGSRPVGQASMENWITSTQIPVGEEIP